MKRITILVDSENINQIWNNIGWLEQIGIKIVDVIETK